MKTSNSLLSILSSDSPASTAVTIPGGPALSYGSLRDEVDRVAELLAGAGLERGSAVSMALPNGLEFLVTFLAVLRAGAIAAPLNPAYTREEFAFCMGDASSRLAILPPDVLAAREAAGELGIPVLAASPTPGGTVELTREGRQLTNRSDPEPPDGSDVALFLHTSGTTSRPKGVPLTHANLLASVENIGASYALSPEDVAMVVMPLFHVHGLVGAALSTLASGGEMVVPSRFSAGAFWPTRTATGATWYSAVPTIHQILLDRADADGAPRESFRFIRSCSAALAPRVLGNLESRFGAPVLEAYGMTEAAHQMTSNPLPPGDRVPGTVGAATGVEVGVMDRDGRFMEAGDVGEVAIKGPNVMGGYRNNPAANQESFSDGWFRTGDQGFLSGDAYLTLTGRIKELINRGGEKISPLEVDAALLAHPSVAEAVCFAAPDSKYGEAVHAAVVLRDDADEAALRTFCGERLAAFKVPDRIYVADSLPRTVTGKIQRRHVAAALLVDG